MFRDRILVIEDSEDLREALVKELRQNYQVEAVPNAEQALIKMRQGVYDLAILDVGLPSMDGFKLCETLRSLDATKHITIIIMSGRIGIEDKLVGFSRGADDYLAKPSDMRELRARIESHLSRRRSQVTKSEIFHIGPFRGDLAYHKISVEDEGQYRELELSGLEFRLLHYFLTHLDHVLSREKLLVDVWGEGRHVSGRVVDVSVSKLRQKLGHWADLLQSVHGVGYRFCSPDKLVKSAG